MMPSTEAKLLPAAIACITVFGLSVGQFGPLMALLLERHGVDASLNGLNAGVTFVGVIIGPLLAPHGVRRFGMRNFLLACFIIDIAIVLAMKTFDSLAAWFILRPLGGLFGSSIFTSSEAWINRLAGDVGRGRIIGIYAASLSAGFGIGPLLLIFTGIEGWPPFLANAAITALAMLPLLAIGNAADAFGREPAGSTFAMFARAPLIIAAIVLFGMYESAMMSLLPIWGVRRGLDPHFAAALLTAVYGGSIVLQIIIGWLSDGVSRTVALRLCGAVGLLGGLLLLGLPPTPLALFALLFVWGGTATGIYPVALSMAGDRFRGADLVSINAAIIIAYGVGALVGPTLGGAAMDLSDPQGLLWLFVLLFAALLIGTARVKARAAAC